MESIHGSWLLPERGSRSFTRWSTRSDGNPSHLMITRRLGWARIVWTLNVRKRMPQSKPLTIVLRLDRTRRSQELKRDLSIAIVGRLSERALVRWLRLVLGVHRSDGRTRQRDRAGSH